MYQMDRYRSVGSVANAPGVQSNKVPSTSVDDSEGSEPC
jgi:hypothetical protein